MIVAVDTSALGKLLVEEAESPALRTHLADGSDAGDLFAVSSLAVAELRRLGIRLDIEVGRVQEVLEPFAVVRLSEAVLQLAGHLPHRYLRTLDAIHLASALAVEAAELLTYDERQSRAAVPEGLQVRAPG